MVKKQLPSFFEENTEAISHRIATGLHKVGLAMKQHSWQQANEEGLSATQGQILAALVGAGPLSGTELSVSLGVTLPTISDSVRVLVDKQLVTKSADPRGARRTCTLVAGVPWGRRRQPLARRAARVLLRHREDDPNAPGAGSRPAQRHVRHLHAF
jgi:MarR family